MRRLAAALIATTLLLTGCSGGSDDPEIDPTPTAEDTAPTASPEDVAALEAVTVTGDLGAAPTLEFEQPFAIDGPVARVDVEGDGEELEVGRLVTIHYAAFSGDDGTVLHSTWDTGTSESFSVGDPEIIPALSEVLAGQKVGVRVLFAAPGGPAREATDTEPAAPAYPASLMAIEVTGLAPSRAEGTAVTPPEGLPTVTLAEDGEPAIEIPADATEPTELVAQTLIEGAGAPVEAGQQLTTHYTGWLWDGTEFDSSWGKTPMTRPVGVGQMVAGWDEGMVGKTVGSQVLLVVPADKGYGDTGQGSIPPGATLVFVVDILSAS